MKIQWPYLALQLAVLADLAAHTRGVSGAGNLAVVWLWFSSMVVAVTVVTAVGQGVKPPPEKLSRLRLTWLSAYRVLVVVGLLATQQLWLALVFVTTIVMWTAWHHNR